MKGPHPGRQAVDPRAEATQYQALYKTIRSSHDFSPVQAATTNSFAEYFPTRPAKVTAAVFSPEISAESADVEAPPPATDEDSKIEEMMNANSSFWNTNQQHIGVGQEFRPRAYRPAFRPQAPVAMPPPPPGYVCFRCGQKGHYIAYCPTNTDPNFDKPKLKKSTGIPRSFLKTVSATDESAGAGVLVTPDGSLVVAVSNDQAWQKVSIAASRSAIDQTAVPAELKCMICTNLMNEPMCCPACKKAFCEECIMQTGPPKDLSCPNCHAAFMADQLIPLDSLKKQIELFLVSLQSKESSSDANPLNAQVAVPPVMPPFPFFPGMLFPPFPMPPFMPPPAVPVASSTSNVKVSREPEHTKEERRDRSRSPEEPSRDRRRRSRSRSPSRSPRRPYRR